jgi:hypothetical protein
MRFLGYLKVDLSLTVMSLNLGNPPEVINAKIYTYFTLKKALPAIEG